MKKLIALLAACCMILSCLPVFAASDRQIFDIKSLGIMQGDENGEMHLEDEITRAEFAQTVLNLIHMPVSQIGSMEGKFSDVPNDAWYAPAVNYIAALGYISGRSGRDFPAGGSSAGAGGHENSGECAGI